MTNKAFSLIELIIWITISMLLMTSIWVFVSSGMKNIFNWQRVLENTNSFSIFSDKLINNLNLIQSWSLNFINTWSWMLLKRSLYFREWWFTYIWTEYLSWVYCEDNSDSYYTNSVYIKNFIPFEEKNEDIFSDYSLVLSSKIVNVSWNIYKTFQKENRVAVKNWSNWDTVIWKWIFWNEFIEWNFWTWVYLNSPTWIATDWTNIFVSDTLNNRIIYLDVSTNKSYILLDESDWLNEPTWLYYEDNTLYISNSLNWEILRYSSSDVYANNPNLTISWINVNWINRIEVLFYKNNWDPYYISSPTDKNDITFLNLLKNDDYLLRNLNKLEYYFVNYNWGIYSEPSCIWTEERIVWWNPIKCISSWTWQTSNYANKDFNDTNITINNILPEITSTWSYYVNLKLFDWITEKYSEYFQYFIKSDDNLTTPGDNTLSVLYSWLNYPTWIWWTWNTDYNVFWDWNYDDLSYQSWDYLLDTPIESLNITNNNDLLTLILKYYKNYNCYNLDENIAKTFITKKNLK